MAIFGQKGALREVFVPAEKKISTASGQRLAEITETRTPPIPPRSALRSKSVQDIEESSTSSVLKGKGGISATIWTDGGGLDPFRNNQHVKKRRAWWRVVFIVAITIVAIIALSLGLGFGLRKTNSNSSNEPSSSSSAVSNSSNSDQSSTTTQSSGSTASSTSTTSADFPAGTYSFTTFLDTVTTDCTSNSDTWTCSPYTIYNSNKKKAMTTSTWSITGSEGSYKISSTDDPVIEFEDVDLELVSEGQDSERYHFQFTMDKEVVPSVSITEDDPSTVCYFNSTIFTGYLYTKMEKDYPTTDDSENPWPYAVRAEQSIGGGEGVPNCYKTVDGRITKQITEGLDAMGASTLCSCLYRNYLTK